MRSTILRRPAKVQCVVISVIVLVMAAIPCLYMGQQARVCWERPALFDAIRARNTAKVKLLLAAGADPNLREAPVNRRTFNLGDILNSEPSEPGTTPLLASVYHVEREDPRSIEVKYNDAPDPEIIQLLLDRGANPNETDRMQTPPVFFAVASGSIRAVDVLLKRGVPVDAHDQAGISLLLTASSQGRTEMVKYPLAQGADINWRNSFGENALICAVRYSRMPDTVKVLLAHGVDPNAKDKYGNSAMSYAKKPDAFLDRSQTARLPEVIKVLTRR